MPLLPSTSKPWSKVPVRELRSPAGPAGTSRSQLIACSSGIPAFQEASADPGDVLNPRASEKVHRATTLPFKGFASCLSPGQPCKTLPYKAAQGLQEQPRHREETSPISLTNPNLFPLYYRQEKKKSSPTPETAPTGGGRTKDGPRVTQKVTNLHLSNYSSARDQAKGLISQGTNFPTCQASPAIPIWEQQSHKGWPTTRIQHSAVGTTERLS